MTLDRRDHPRHRDRVGRKGAYCDESIEVRPWCGPCGGPTAVRADEWFFWILGVLVLWIIHGQGALLLLALSAVLVALVRALLLGLE